MDSNILLSVNAIIISIALSSLIPKLDNAHSHLVIPTFIMLMFSVVSIILLYSTRPKVTTGTYKTRYKR
jgi:Na+/glutamate symporter